MCLLGEAAAVFFERLNGCVRRGGPWKNVNINGTQMECKFESWLPWWPSKLYSMGVVLATRSALFCTRPWLQAHSHTSCERSWRVCFVLPLSGSSYGILWHMLDDVGKTNLSRHLKISCCKITYILISRLWWSEMSPWLPVVITRCWVDSGMRPRIKFRSVSTVLSILQSIIVFASVKVSDH